MRGEVVFGNWKCSFGFEGKKPRGKKPVVTTKREENGKG